MSRIMRPAQEGLTAAAAVPHATTTVVAAWACSVTNTTLRLMHDRIDKHVVRFGEFGPLSSSLTTSFMFYALIRKRAAWKNLLAMPGNIVFPRSEPRRFEFAYQIGRLRNAVRRQR